MEALVRGIGVNGSEVKVFKKIGIFEWVLCRWLCYRTHVWLLAAQKLVIEKQVSVERKDALTRKASNLERRWTQAGRSTPKILLNHDCFWREKEGRDGRWGISVNQGRSWVLHRSLLCADWPTLFGCNFAHTIRQGLVCIGESISQELV